MTYKEIQADLPGRKAKANPNILGLAETTG